MHGSLEKTDPEDMLSRACANHTEDQDTESLRLAAAAAAVAVADCAEGVLFIVPDKFLGLDAMGKAMHFFSQKPLQHRALDMLYGCIALVHQCHWL